MGTTLIRNRAFMLLQASPASRSPTGLTGEAIRTEIPHYLKSISGEDSWSDPVYSFHMRVFTDAMTAPAKSTTAAFIKNYPAGFEGIRSAVDVGDRHGAALESLVEAFPWVRRITFDLPTVVAEAPPRKGVEFVGGSMFESARKADAFQLMSILHDWSDKACVEIIKKCKEAIPDIGKVIIIDAILNEDEFAGARLSLDMFMMAVTAKGKERTYKEWACLLEEADSVGTM